MINWYNEVSRNLAKIPDCVAYFDKELIEAKKIQLLDDAIALL